VRRFFLAGCPDLDEPVLRPAFFAAFFDLRRLVRTELLVDLVSEDSWTVVNSWTRFRSPEPCAEGPLYESDMVRISKLVRITDDILVRIARLTSQLLLVENGFITSAGLFGVGRLQSSILMLAP
jgi:hypothetical protein